MPDKENDLILKNCMEDVVKSIMEEVLPKYPDLCKCDVCLHDITALTLNELPPKYVVREKGEVYAKVNILEVQYRADVYAALSKAIEKVRKNPRHYS